MNQANIKPRTKKESYRVAKSGRVIKTPKAILTTSSDEAPRRQRSSKKAITVRSELQRLRAIAKNISAEPQKAVGEDEVTATAAIIEKSTPDVIERRILNISTHIDQTNPKLAIKATDKLHRLECSGIETPTLARKTINTTAVLTICKSPESAGCSKIQIPIPKTAKKKLTDEQDMDKSVENLAEECEENFEDSSEVNSYPVNLNLQKKIIQRNKDIQKQNMEIQQQNRDILQQNLELKQQIENILEQQKLCTAEFGQRSVGEEMTAQLYEPLDGFPLETVEQFHEIDTAASKKSIRNRLYVHLCNLGGSRLREFLNCALKQVMTDKLVNSFTWPGCKTSAKFGDTKIANVLYLAAKKCPLFRGPDTKAEFKMEMLEVFRSTKQRFRNSLKKSLAIKSQEGDDGNQEQVSARIRRLEQTLDQSSEDEDFSDDDTDN